MTLKKDSLIYKFATFSLKSVFVSSYTGETEIQEITAPKTTCSLFWHIFGNTLLLLFCFPLGFLVKTLNKKFDIKRNSKGFREDMFYWVHGAIANFVLILLPLLFSIVEEGLTFEPFLIIWSLLAGLILFVTLIYFLIKLIIKLLENREEPSKIFKSTKGTFSSFKEKHCKIINWEE